MMRYGIIGAVTVGLLSLLIVTVPQFTAVTYNNPEQVIEPAEMNSTSSTETNSEELVEEQIDDNREVVKHQPLPDAVRAIYMTACVAGTPSFRNRLIDLIESTEINAVVIDVKDFSGTISFPPKSEAWRGAWQNANCGTSDMKELLATLHEKEVFTIARLTVFQDPYYTGVRPDLAVKKADGVTVWNDYKKLSFIDVAAQEYWDHIIELSQEAYNLGFDEINYDYIRYPSDGPMSDISFPHSEAGDYGLDYQANLEAFFSYLHEKMTDEDLFSQVRHENTGRASNTPWLSADLFGMTTTNYDDLSIGQVQDRAAPYFDFIAPMVYPSHYPDSFLGLGDPNLYPYRVVNYAMQSGVDRMTSSTTPIEGFKHEPLFDTNASGTRTFTGLYTKPVYGPDKFRTWIQDFDYGGDYDAADVRAQIQASYDAGVNSWMIWAPSNIYTREALNLQ